jgi:hypothetical protein
MSTNRIRINPTTLAAQVSEAKGGATMFAIYQQDPLDEKKTKGVYLTADEISVLSSIANV